MGRGPCRHYLGGLTVDVVCTGRGTHPPRSLVALVDVPEVGDGALVLSTVTHHLGVGGTLGHDQVPSPARVGCPSCGRQVNRTWEQLRLAAAVVDTLDISRV